MGTGVGVARTALGGGGAVVWLTTGGAELQLARSTAAPTNVNTIARRTADRERTELITPVYRAVEAKSYVAINAIVQSSSDDKVRVGTPGGRTQSICGAPSAVAVLIYVLARIEYAKCMVGAAVTNSRPSAFIDPMGRVSALVRLVTVAILLAGYGGAAPVAVHALTTPASTGAASSARARPREPDSTRGITINVNSAGKHLDCRLPISLIAKGESGFVSFRHGSATFSRASSPTPDAAGAGPVYLSAFGAWEMIPPSDVAPGGKAYVIASLTQEGSTITIVRLAGQKSVWQTQSPVDVVGWGPDGIVVMNTQTQALSLLDPTTGASRPIPGGQSLAGDWVHYLPASNSVWTQSNRAGDAVIVSQNIATGAQRTWYSSSSGYAYSIAITASGLPLVQTSPYSVQLVLAGKQQVGLPQQLLLMTAPGQPRVVNKGVIGHAGVAAALNSATFTTRTSVWMSDGLGRVWRYTKGGGLQQIAQITDRESAEVLALAGPCK